MTNPTTWNLSTATIRCRQGSALDPAAASGGPGSPSWRTCGYQDRWLSGSVPGASVVRPAGRSTDAPDP